MDMLGRINCELNEIDVSEVIEVCLSNEADLTTVNRHTKRMLQLVLQLTLFKVLVWTQSLTCNCHSVCIQCLSLLLSNI